jgi:hypothetical protein
MSHPSFSFAWARGVALLKSPQRLRRRAGLAIGAVRAKRASGSRHKSGQSAWRLTIRASRGHFRRPRTSGARPSIAGSRAEPLKAQSTPSTNDGSGESRGSFGTSAKPQERQGPSEEKSRLATAFSIGRCRGARRARPLSRRGSGAHAVDSSDLCRLVARDFHADTDFDNFRCVPDHFPSSTFEAIMRPDQSSPTPCGKANANSFCGPLAGLENRPLPQ